MGQVIETKSNPNATHADLIHLSKRVGVSIERVGGRFRVIGHRGTYEMSELVGAIESARNVKELNNKASARFNRALKVASVRGWMIRTEDGRSFKVVTRSGELIAEGLSLVQMESTVGSAK